MNEKNKKDSTENINENLAKKLSEKTAEKVEKHDESSKEGLKKANDALVKKATDLTDSLQRLQAEFENFKKRNEKEKCDFKEYSKKDLIEKLLPVLDSFELAIKNCSDPNSKKGLELVYSQIYSILEKEGLRAINAVGQKLDPFKHEALLSEKSDKSEDTILEELSKGYMLKDFVLRTSKVKISKK